MAVIGSREQLCIHPEVSKKETNVEKVGQRLMHYCTLKSCIISIHCVCRFICVVPRFTIMLVSITPILIVSILLPIVSCHNQILCGSMYMYTLLHFAIIVKRLQSSAGEVLDIEDLMLIGTRQRMCPYYLARELKSQADVIFMPYNYILDVKVLTMSVSLNTNNLILLH